MIEEPAIIVLIKEDHKDGLHDDPNNPNKYCPLCTEDILVKEIEDYLGG